MKKWLPAILLVCALAGVVWYLIPAPPGKSRTGDNPSQTETPDPAAETSLPGLRAGAETTPPASPAAKPAPPPVVGGTSTNSLPAPATPFVLGSADTPPSMDSATVLSNMRVTVNHYRSMVGENPIGTNPEITLALNGENGKQAKFITEESGLRINGRGELVDYWGTPFFFHQLSGAEMEIHSAGPDKVMWTADDLVTR